MGKFRDMITESPVGSRGRTSAKEAELHVTSNPQLEDEFKKIVRKLGGKTVVAKILANMNTKRINEAEEIDDEDESEEIRTVEDYEEIFADILEDVNEMKRFGKEIGLSNEQVNPINEALVNIERVDDVIREKFSEADIPSKEDDGKW